MGRIIEPFKAKSNSNVEILVALETLSCQIFNFHRDMDEWEKRKVDSIEEMAEKVDTIAADVGTTIREQLDAIRFNL